MISFLLRFGISEYVVAIPTVTHFDFVDLALIQVEYIHA